MDSRFFNNFGPFDIAHVANHIKAELVVPNNPHSLPELIKINNVESIERAQSGDLTFLNNPKYLPMLQSTQAVACIMRPEVAAQNRCEKLWCLVHPNPYFAYANALDLFYLPKVQRANHIEKTAYIDHTAKIANGVYIGHNTVIEAGVEVGENTSIGSNCFIGHGVSIGSNTRIDSNVTISYSVVGNDVIILPGARIGQDGFGFATERGRHKKIFHVGIVIIEDDVEIGANTTIDRGSVNNTVIKSGARLDNLVQLGHNVEIGKGSILVSQVGVAGSSVIGNYCALGGQVGVAGHVHVVDKVHIAGQSGVTKSLEEPGMYFGTPALPIREWQKQNMVIKKMLEQ
jgi:UDP-3-O-[3-hydroxymyristoyl] glucosamine N-acyltransferase